MPLARITGLFIAGCVAYSGFQGKGRGGGCVSRALFPMTQPDWHGGRVSFLLIVAVIAVAIAGVVGAGCSESQLPVAAPDGYELFDASAHGFEVALPASWAAFDLTSGDQESMLAEMERLFAPEVTNDLRRALASGVNQPLYAVDVAGTGNINVIVSAPGPLGDLAGLEQVATAQLQAAGATVLSTDRIDVSDTESVHVEFRSTLTQVNFWGHQYYVPTETATYIITFTSLDPDADLETFAAVIGTFLLVDD